MVCASSGDRKGREKVIVLNNPNLFLKGTCEVTVKRPSDGRVIFQSTKVATNNFTSEVDMGEIRAGLGNSISIQLPINAGVNLELTTADFSLNALAMQIGEETTYNAIIPVCDVIAADPSTQGPTFHIDPETMELVMDYPENTSSDAFSLLDGDLYVNDPGNLRAEDYSIDAEMYLIANAAVMGLSLIGASPVAGYGDNEPYCYVNRANAADLGKAYRVLENGRIDGFTAMVGRNYNVMYYERKAFAQELDIPCMFAPGIYTVTATMAVFSAGSSEYGQRGSQVGWARYYIPRMQFNGGVAVSGDQTDADTTSLNGTALSYNEASRIGVCQDCTFPMLAYMTYTPIAFNGGNDIVGMVLVGGNMRIPLDESAMPPVKFVMANGTIVQPDFKDLTFTIADEKIAEIVDGVITGMEEGETQLTIQAPDGSGIQPITVGIAVA